MTWPHPTARSRGEKSLNERPNHHQADEAPDDEGIAASSSITTLSVSFTLPVANSETVNGRSQANRDGDY